VPIGLGRPVPGSRGSEPEPHPLGSEKGPFSDAKPDGDHRIPQDEPYLSHPSALQVWTSVATAITTVSHTIAQYELFTLT
jgi:hypothetical protein